MAAYKGPYYGASPVYSEENWEPTPWWKWIRRYVFKQTWQREFNDGLMAYEPVIEYQTDYERASQILEETCGRA